MKRLRIRLRTTAFLLFVWLYVVYLFGVLIPYAIRGAIPWVFIGKSYLRAVNYSTSYQVPISYQPPTIYSVLPGTMPFIEREIIIAEYAILNNPIVPESLLTIMVAIGLYVIASGLFRIRFSKRSTA